jgi:hypothetical protein
VAVCRVSYRDIEAVRHEVQVEADSLYEAVAKAVHVFRKNHWDGHPPGPGCEFTVEIRPEPSVRYTVSLSKVEQHAKYATARGPSDILRKQRLRQLLGVDEQ